MLHSIHLYHYYFVTSLQPVKLGQQLHVQGFASTERVLDGMVKIAVAELGAEASVRRHLRELYVKHACVSTGMHALQSLCMYS